jgi:putative transposase
VGKNPTDRAKPGTQQSVLVEGDGGPLGVVIAGANVPDFQLLDETIRAVVVERPDPEEVEQHLGLDAGYDNEPTRETVEKHGDVGHTRPAREGPRPKRRPGRRKARRWVVERTLAGLSKCRALLVRYDKHDENYLGLIQLACGLLWYRRLKWTPNTGPLDRGVFVQALPISTEGRQRFQTSWPIVLRNPSWGRCVRVRLRCPKMRLGHS